MILQQVIILQLFECRHNGLGLGKFWNTRFFYKVELKDQLSSSYDATKTYTVLLKRWYKCSYSYTSFTAGMNSVAKMDNSS
jgi:hypothetical protein